MKFGKYLSENITPDWRFYYIDYDGLKKLLKVRTAAESFFVEEDEAHFVDVLDREMQKVFDFRDVKAGELTRHVQHCENVVDHINPQNPHELESVKEEIGRITSELSQLSTFTRINYTGFLKILKKHDKHTEFMLKPMFMLRLRSKPMYLENLDNLVYRLSKLYDRIRSDDPSRKSPKQTTIDLLTGPQVFVRKTSKYWVHADNVTEVKCYILKYLPVLIFPSKRRNIDLAVSSVYFDNDDLELYRGRLEKTEGAIAIRIRWYGSEDPSEVFIERKVHREDWTGEISVKARFPIKEKHVNSFIAGTYKPEDVIDRLRKDPKRKESEIQELGQLAKEIQEVIISKKLKPIVRTFYNRTAFQLPGNARVRISLDTELTMIREDGPKRSGNNWKREDLAGEAHQFSGIDHRDIVRFPHAILEVKLQTQSGQGPPKWADALVNSHLVEEVPKFSKFIHGCAALFPDQVPMLPFWLPQMDVDIRKKAPEYADEDSDDDNAAFSSAEQSSPDPHTEQIAEEGPSSRPTPHLVIPIEDHLEGESAPLLKPPEKEGGVFGLISSMKKNKVAPSPSDDPPAHDRSEANAAKTEKKIYVPIRIEPKVFFANERTFLSWIHFAIFLGGIATALVGLGNQSAKVSGYLFAGVSILFTAYALYLYQWRAARIRERDPGPYDDRVGPTVVVAVFMAAMIVNLIFVITSQPTNQPGI